MRNCCSYFSARELSDPSKQTVNDFQTGSQCIHVKRSCHIMSCHLYYSESTIFSKCWTEHIFLSPPPPFPSESSGFEEILLRLACNGEVLQFLQKFLDRRNVPIKATVCSGVRLNGRMTNVTGVSVSSPWGNCTVGGLSGLAHVLLPAVNSSEIVHWPKLHPVLSSSTPCLMAAYPARTPKSARERTLFHVSYIRLSSA